MAAECGGYFWRSWEAMGERYILYKYYIYIRIYNIYACMEITNDMIRVSSKMGDGLPNFCLCLWEKLRPKKTRHHGRSLSLAWCKGLFTGKWLTMVNQILDNMEIWIILDNIG